jgi:hypothetical protein
MYTYRCPGCGKHHVVDSSFEQEYQSRCLRCGSAIAVTSELIHQAQEQVGKVATVPLREQAITKGPTLQATPESSERRSEAATFSVSESDVIADDEPEVQLRQRNSVEEELVASEKRRKNKRVRRPAKRSEEQEEDADEVIDDSDLQTEDEEDKPTPPWKQPPPVVKRRRPPWQLIAAIAAAVLIIGGGGVGYLVFGGKKTPQKSAPVAKKNSDKPKKPTPPTTKKVEEKQPPPPAPKGPPKVEVALSAPRLSDELKENAAETNDKYGGKVLELTGLYHKIEQKEGLHPPARPHAAFLTAGTPIYCDLEGNRAEKGNWNSLLTRQPFTVRGRYVKDGFLKECWLMPVTPTADHKFKGKTIEVVGIVEEVSPISERHPFPTVRLEGETNSTVPLTCFFPKSDAAQVKKIQPGAELIIKGACNGRQTDEDLVSRVRVDNCAIIYTSAPSADTPRLKAGQLLHEYEEDIRTDYVPPPGAEKRIDKILPAKQIAKEFAEQGAPFAEKYRNHVMTLTGKLQAGARKQLLMLESGDTDQALRIECHFSKAAVPTLGKRPEVRVRGLCSGLRNTKTLRMDNCELDEPAGKGPILSADFLPHSSGRTFTFDVAVFGGNYGKKKGESVQREIHLQGADGLTETTVTHVGTLMGDSLFDEGAQEKWIAQNKTKKVKGTLAGLIPVYYRRLSAGFVEMGLPSVGADGKTKTTWAPALKIGAREGDTWTWSPPSGTHEYTLVKFEEYEGRPCALVQEKITLAADFRHPVEILHTYVKGLGEMEERRWMSRNARGDKVLLMEKKAVKTAQPRRENGARGADGTGRRQPGGTPGPKANPSSTK